MALSYGFYNSSGGDRRYNAEQISSIFNYLITEGVLASVGEHFGVVPGQGRQVIVKSGWAWFNSSWTNNDSDMPLNLEAPDISVDRIDAVIIETNKNLDVRANTIKIITGVPSSSPQKPAMANTTAISQHPVAYVTVRAGMTSVSLVDIEIVVGKDECPFITSILQSTSIEVLFNQWEGEFDAWFQHIQTVLSEEVVTNLYAEIDKRVKIEDKATEAEAIAGTDNTKWMTPATTKAAVEGKFEEKFEFLNEFIPFIPYSNNWFSADSSNMYLLGYLNNCAIAVSKTIISSTSLSVSFYMAIPGKRSVLIETINNIYHDNTGTFYAAAYGVDYENRSLYVGIRVRKDSTYFEPFQITEEGSGDTLHCRLYSLHMSLYSPSSNTSSSIVGKNGLCYVNTNSKAFYVLHNGSYIGFSATLPTTNISCICSSGKYVLLRVIGGTTNSKPVYYYKWDTTIDDASALSVIDTYTTTSSFGRYCSSSGASVSNGDTYFLEMEMASNSSYVPSSTSIVRFTTSGQLIREHTFTDSIVRHIAKHYIFEVTSDRYIKAYDIATLTQKRINVVDVYSVDIRTPGDHGMEPNVFFGSDIIFPGGSGTTYGVHCYIDLEKGTRMFYCHSVTGATYSDIIYGYSPGLNTIFGTGTNYVAAIADLNKRMVVHSIT